MGNEGLRVLKAEDLYTFPDNPFKVPPDSELTELTESIRNFGMMVPIITRPRDEGGYEIISGQRRVRASVLAGVETIPAFVLYLDDEKAVITLVDSNMQRENILPSERAFSFKMKLETLKKQGFRTDLTSSQHGTKSRSDEQIAKGFGISRMTVQRYIRLTELIPDILKMVDDNRIALLPAVEVSYLKKSEQADLFTTMESEQATPSHSQAIRMKNLSRAGKLDMDAIFEIMTEEKPNQREVLKIRMDKLRRYFGRNATPEQIESAIIKLLERELKRKLERGR